MRLEICTYVLSLVVFVLLLFIFNRDERNMKLCYQAGYTSYSAGYCINVAKSLSIHIDELDR